MTTRRRTALLAGAALCLVLVLLLGLLITHDRSPLDAFDRAGRQAEDWIDEQPLLVRALRVVELAFAGIGMVAWTAAAVLVLLSRRRVRAAAFAVAVTVTASLATTAMKVWLARGRPDWQDHTDLVSSSPSRPAMRPPPLRWGESSSSSCGGGCRSEPCAGPSPGFWSPRGSLSVWTGCSSGATSPPTWWRGRCWGRHWCWQVSRSSTRPPRDNRAHPRLGPGTSGLPGLWTRTLVATPATRAGDRPRRASGLNRRFTAVVRLSPGWGAGSVSSRVSS